MGRVARNLVAALALAAAASVAPAADCAVELPSSATQGGLVAGRVARGCTVEFAGRSLRLAADGGFTARTLAAGLVGQPDVVHLASHFVLDAAHAIRLAEEAEAGFNGVDVARDRAGFAAIVQNAEGRMMLVRAHGNFFAKLTVMRVTVKGTNAQGKEERVVYNLHDEFCTKTNT